MEYFIVSISIFYILIGFLLTKNNAKYLLAGYNSMTAEQRPNFNLDTYIPFFRNFHIFLGLTHLFVGLGLFFFVGETYSGIFLGVYPILAYIWFIWKTDAKDKYLGISILIFSLVFVVILFLAGIKENQWIETENEIRITGIYGETIPKSQILKLTSIQELPVIKMKTNGYATGKIRKGYFKTKQGEVIKLILNSDQGPYVYILKQNGKKIYFGPK
jgi:hypothetical protein